MFTIKSSEDFIQSIRSIDSSLESLKLKNVEIEKSTGEITFNFICDRFIEDALKEKMEIEALKFSQPFFNKVFVVVKKVTTDCEIVRRDIFKYMSNNYPSISMFLNITDVVVVKENELVKYTLILSKDGVDYVNKNGVIFKLNNLLERSFCSKFSGSTKEKEETETIDLLSEEVFENELQRVEHRTIKVSEVIAIDDFEVEDTAIYIEDAVDAGNVTICGLITDIQERKTKNDKPFFIIHLDDTTSRTSGIYFTRKNTLHKIRELAVGDGIIVRGRIENKEDGKRSLVMEKINRCTFPNDFVKKDKFKKSAPKEYKLVFPSPANTIKVTSVFDDNDLPKELTDNVYVVFDLETTGIEVRNNGITEIGAVKIIGGQIKEQFTCLIKPDYPITAENAGITGITEEMVKDCPRINAVLPDFLKFIEGSVLVAQNTSFDMGFLKRFAHALEYEVKNKTLDTMEMYRAYKPGTQHADLKTIAEHFKIVFHHHRALSDAYATAEAFIEMMKAKYKN